MKHKVTNFINIGQKLFNNNTVQCIDSFVSLFQMKIKKILCLLCAFYPNYLQARPYKINSLVLRPMFVKIDEGGVFFTFLLLKEKARKTEE